MAKAKGTSDVKKLTFGTRKQGKAKKSFNKHTPRPKAYKGQGR